MPDDQDHGLAADERTLRRPEPTAEPAESAAPSNAPQLETEAPAPHPADEAEALLARMNDEVESARRRLHDAINEQQEAAAAAAAASDVLSAAKRESREPGADRDAATKSILAASHAAKDAGQRLQDAKAALGVAQGNYNALKQAQVSAEREAKTLTEARRKEEDARAAEEEARRNADEAEAEAEARKTAAAGRIAAIRDGIRARRRARATWMAGKLALFTGLPTLIVGFYFLVFSTDFFESEALVTIRAPEATASSAGGVGSLLGQAANVGASQDSVSVIKYVLSRDVLSRLDQDHGFIAHYQSGEIDGFSRLSADASFEEAYAYYLASIDAEFDPLEGVIALRLRATTPDAAQTFITALISYSEEKVNELTARVYAGQVAAAEDTVAKAEGRMKAARERMRALQRRLNRLDPEASAEGELKIITELQSRLAEMKVERNSLIARGLSRSAPTIRALDESIRSLERQIKANEDTLLNVEGRASLGEAIAEFDAAKFDMEIATKVWESALLSLETARQDALRQHRYLAVVASPSLPDRVTHPLRLQNTVLAFLIALSAYGLFTLSVTVVREHALQ